MRCTSVSLRQSRVNDAVAEEHTILLLINVGRSIKSPSDRIDLYLFVVTRLGCLFSNLRNYPVPEEKPGK